ncbi:MAG: ABC transporter permease [Planctomycetota bacterium]
MPTNPKETWTTHRGKTWSVRLTFLMAVLLLWETIARLHIWPDYLFPAPSGVAATLIRGFRDQTFFIAISRSLWRLIRGYVAATAGGLALGMLLAQSRGFKTTFGMLVMGLQTLPSICWLPLALLWFGLNEQAIIFVIVMGSMLSVAQATEDGIRNSPPVYIQAARNLGADGVNLYLRVIFPSAWPSIVTGMKMGWSFAWRSLMAGELLYAVPGLGNLLAMGRELNDMNQVVAVIIVIITLGLISDKLIFAALEKQVRAKWGFQK